MASNEGEFWDSRFQQEGAIWGEGPSATARAAAPYLAAGTRLLDTGFGYGRDLLYFAQRGCSVSGIDPSRIGRRMAVARLDRAGVSCEQLATGDFENGECPSGPFDAIISHRVVHLLVDARAVVRFAQRVRQILRPGGLLCIGARNPGDFNSDLMHPVDRGVFEYRSRPGHRIRYWDDDDFTRVFGDAFVIRALLPAVEIESLDRPGDCHLTVMIAESLARE